MLTLPAVFKFIMWASIISRAYSMTNVSLQREEAKPLTARPSDPWTSSIDPGLREVSWHFNASTYREPYYLKIDMVTFLQLSTERILGDGLLRARDLEDDYGHLPYLVESPSVQLFLQGTERPPEGDLTYGLYYYLMKFLESFLIQWGGKEWMPTFDLRLESTQDHFREEVKGIFTTVGGQAIVS